MEDPRKDYALDYNEPTTLNKYFEFVTSFQKFGAYLGYEYGFDTFFREFVIGDIFMNLYMKIVNPTFGTEDICTRMFFESENPLY